MPISEYAPEPTPPSDAADEPSKQDAVPWRSWFIAAAVVAVLAIGAVFLLGGSGDDGGADAVAAADTAADGAQTPGGAGFGPGARGTITSIDGSTITIEADDAGGSSGPTTVETSDDTTVTETIDGSIDDLAVGDTVTALGEADDNGTVAATAVIEGGGAFGRPGGGQPPADGQLPQGGGFPGGGQGMPTAGEITAIDGDTLTLDVDGESVTVTVGDDTTVSITEERSLDDLAEGDVITAIGETDGDVLTATSIRVGDGGFGGFGGGGFPPGGPGATEEG